MAEGKSHILRILQNSSEISEKTFKENIELVQLAEGHLRMLEETWDMYPELDYIPEHYNTPMFVYTELEASILLSLAGLYDASLASLRIALETAFFKLHHEDGHTEEFHERLHENAKEKIKEAKKEGDKEKERYYRAWMHHANPRFATAVDSFWEWAVVREFSKDYRPEKSIRSEILDLHKALNSHVHPSSYRVLGKYDFAQTARYDKDDFEHWATCFYGTVRLITLIVLFADEETAHHGIGKLETLKVIYPDIHKSATKALNDFKEWSDNR